MLILGIDTTAAIATVALSCDEKIKASYFLNSTLEHSASLLPIIEDVLVRASVKIRDLDLICVSNGPGSFTGIRIGISTAKGLAYSDNIPCVGVSSLESMAFMFRDLEGTICPVINARNSNVYTAIFESDGDGKITRNSEDDILKIEELKELIGNNKTYFTGDAYDLVVPHFTGDKMKKTPSLLKNQNAYGVILAGYEKFKLSQDKNAHDFSHKNLKPVYLRKTLAERQRLSK